MFLGRMAMSPTLLDSSDEGEYPLSRKTLCLTFDLTLLDCNLAVIHGTSISIYRRHTPWPRYMLLPGAS